MPNANNYVIIMAGGIGSRFWPVSREEFPKQFLDIFKTGQTLIQQTFRRFSKIILPENIYVLTSEAYVNIVAEQLPLLPKTNILAEPHRRNTAPCVAYMCFKLMKLNPDASLVVAPSDNLIFDEDSFSQICNRALEFIKAKDALVTIGIKPSYPSTGYGYIQKYPTAVEACIYPVKQFIEKPYLTLAKSLVNNEDFLWNSGIFMGKAIDILEAYRKHLPDLHSLFNDNRHLLNTEDEKSFIAKNYSKCPDISIDLGIIEKSDNLYIISSDFGWCDVGTWNSAWECMEKDNTQNALTGREVRMIDAMRCVVYTSSDKIVVIQGLEDFIVADTNEALLICKRENEQEIKNYVSEIKKTRMPVVV